MEYVNIFGEAVSTTPSGPQKKRATRSAPQQFHKGWRVLGYSPEHIEAARQAHQGPRPWSADEYMLTHAPKPVQARPFEVHSAAQTCAEMAEKAGWIGVRVQMIAKGGQS